MTNSQRGDASPAGPRRALLIYATRSALRGLTDDGEVLRDGDRGPRSSWLKEHIAARAHELGGCQIALEHHAAPGLADQLLRRQPGARAVFREGAWRSPEHNEDAALGGLASFLQWARRELQADQLSLLILGDVLDVEDEDDAAKISEQARSLASCFGRQKNARPLGLKAPETGSRPLGLKAPETGSRPLGLKAPETGSRPLGLKAPETGSRPLGLKAPETGSRPLGLKAPETGSRPLGPKESEPSEQQLARVLGLDDGARMFARAHRVIDAIAAASAGAPKLALVGADDSTLSYVGVALELAPYTSRVVTTSPGLPRATGPLGEFLDWLATGDERAALAGFSERAGVLRARCHAALVEFSRGGDRALVALAHQFAHSAAYCSIVDTARLNPLRAQLERFAAASRAELERATADEREQFYLYITRALAGVDARTMSRDMLEFVDLLFQRTGQGMSWRPGAEYWASAVALRRAFLGCFSESVDARPESLRGVRVYLPVRAELPVPEEYFHLGILRAPESLKPSEWMQLLVALRQVAGARSLDERALRAAAAEQRMLYDLTAFWTRRATAESGPREGPSRASTIAPREQWGVVIHSFVGDSGELVALAQRHNEAPSPVRVALLGAKNERGDFLEVIPGVTMVKPRPPEPDLRRGDAGLVDALLRSVRLCHARRLCVVIRGAADERAPFFLGEDELYSGRQQSITTLATTLRTVLDRHGVERLELLILHAPRSLTLEVAYEFRDVARRLLVWPSGAGQAALDYDALLRGLAATVAPEGAFFQATLAALAATSRQRSLEELRREWEDRLLREAVDAAARSSGGAARALDLERVEELSRHLDAVCRLLFNHLDKEEVWSLVQVALKTIERGGRLTSFVGELGEAVARSDRWRPTQRDEGAEIEQIIAQLKTARESVARALDQQFGARADELLLDSRTVMPRDMAQLRFHQEVHLFALLSSWRLLSSTASHKLWDIIRSSLAYTSGRQRGELLRKLADQRHVVRFASLAPPPSITLSLEPGVGRVDRATGRRLELDDDVRYRVRLSSSGAGAALAQGSSSVNPRAIDEALGGLDMLLGNTSATQAEWNYLLSLGDSLGEDIVGDLSEQLKSLRRALEREEDDPRSIIHLVLRIPRELMRYPWELMSDGEMMLARRFALGRQVWTDTPRVITPEERDNTPMRALIVGDPKLLAPYTEDDQLAGAKQEAEEVAETFERLARELGRAMDFRRDRDVFIGTVLTRSAMRRLLRDRGYDIVHFAGHGMFHAGHPERSAWLLSDGPLWASELRNTFSWSRSPPWLIYANACEAGMNADAGSSRYTGDVFGLATACINQGVKAYIAPLWPIDDRSAKSMATSFYRELVLRRATLGAALYTARRETERIARGGALGDPLGTSSPKTSTSPLDAFDISWASMVLYGDPRARLNDALVSMSPIEKRAARPAAQAQRGAATPRVASLPRETSPIEPTRPASPSSGRADGPKPAPPIVANWLINDGSGAIAYDNTNTGAHGAIHGSARWLGRHLIFDGASWIDCGTKASLRGAAPFTVTAWIKTTASGTIIQQRDGGFDGAYALRVKPSGHVSFFVYGDGATQFSISSADTVNDGAWRHVAAVRDGDEGRVYLDGVQSASGSGPARSLQSSIAVAIGADARDQSKRFSGFIYDVCVFQSALSPEELAALASIRPLDHP